MEVNQEAGAPAAQTSEGVQKPEANTQAPSASDVVTSTPKDGQPAPAATPTQEHADINWNEKYGGLEKRYKEAQNKLREMGTQNKAFSSRLESMDSHLKQLSQFLTDAAKGPYDPDKFMEDMRARGPQAIQDAIKSILEAKEKEYTGKLSGMENQIRAVVSESVVKDCRANAEVYPGFKELEAEMTDILEGMRADHKAGILEADPDAVDPRELVDFLYKSAKAQHSEEAIVKAKELAKKEIEEENAREAQTVVASGGRQVVTKVPDLDKMSLEEERAYWVKKVGEAS